MKRPNILHSGVIVRVTIHAARELDAYDCLEDIRREVQRVAGRKVLEKRYNVIVTAGEAYID